MTILGPATPAVLPLGHHTGYRPDAEAKRDLLAFSHTLFGDSPTFPLASSSESLEGDVLDQSGTSGCTGHGTSQAIEVSAKKAGVPLPFRPSPRSIYDNARVVELPVGAPLTDNGAEPIDVVATVAAKGIRAMVLPSPLGYASDCDTSNVNVLPTAEELQAEHAHLEPGAYRIDTRRSAWLDQLCAAIDQHGAAGIGTFVDSAFEAYTPDAGPVQTVNLQDPNGGGHWLAVTSYRTVLAGSDDAVRFGLSVGTRIFRGPNSWGASWGDRGHWEVVEDVLLAACSDCYGFAVQAAAGPSCALLDRIVAAVKAAM